LAWSRMSFILNLLYLSAVKQDLFSSFGLMFTLFIVVFIIIVALIICIFVFNFWKMAKEGKAQDQTFIQPLQPAVVQKEIVREVVKIRCPYCGNLYDEDQDKCPTCGAKR
jgi:flagellar basal body-associated protein FliL